MRRSDSCEEDQITMRIPSESIRSGHKHTQRYQEHRGMPIVKIDNRSPVAMTPSGFKHQAASAGLQLDGLLMLELATRTLSCTKSELVSIQLELDVRNIQDRSQCLR
jgi:hypothetical protein